MNVIIVLIKYFIIWSQSMPYLYIRNDYTYSIPLYTTATLGLVAPSVTMKVRYSSGTYYLYFYSDYRLARNINGSYLRTIKNDTVYFAGPAYYETSISRSATGTSSNASGALSIPSSAAASYWTSYPYVSYSVRGGGAGGSGGASGATGGPPTGSAGDAYNYGSAKGGYGGGGGESGYSGGAPGASSGTTYSLTPGTSITYYAGAYGAAGAASTLGGSGTTSYISGGASASGAGGARYGSVAVAGSGVTRGFGTAGNDGSSGVTPSTVTGDYHSYFYSNGAAGAAGGSSVAGPSYSGSGGAGGSGGKGGNATHNSNATMTYTSAAAGSAGASGTSGSGGYSGITIYYISEYASV
jgi:hypothetical protein